MPYATINNIKMYYELHGTGETIVFLNGILANTSSWMNQVPYFAKQFQILLLDFRGQGKSEKPLMKYPMELHADDLKALMQELKISSAHIVGISFGGEVALIFAVKYPKMVKSLTVSCAVSHVDPVVKAIVERWLIAARLRSGKYLFQAVYPDIFSDEFIEKRWDFISNTAPLYDTSVDIDAFIELLKGFMQLNITSELYRIKKPTLVIAAENDKIKPPKYSRIIHSKIPKSRFVIIKNSGHAVIWERPEEFNNLVLRFIKEQQR
ncbi:MAG: alpha/beta hydrolase [Candidatus Bathyarchaeia archaeon]